MQKLLDMVKRSIGVILFAFIPGMASGAATGIGPLLGGLNGIATVFSSIIIYFGIQLAWDANISHEDIEKGFRAAVAKQASENKDVAAAVKVAAQDSTTLDDFGDLSELFDGEEPVVDAAEPVESTDSPAATAE